MKWLSTIGFLLLVCFWSTNYVNAQVNPSVEELHKFYNNQKLQITWREGEVLYGTYYFLEGHYCPNGYYGLYGNSVKRTVLGNEQRSNWKEFGTWKITTQNNINGILYTATNGGQNFYPLYKNANGDIYYGNMTIVNLGLAICAY